MARKGSFRDFLSFSDSIHSSSPRRVLLACLSATRRDSMRCVAHKPESAERQCRLLPMGWTRGMILRPQTTGELLFSSTKPRNTANQTARSRERLPNGDDVLLSLFDSRGTVASVLVVCLRLDSTAAARRRRVCFRCVENWKGIPIERARSRAPRQMSPRRKR